MICMQRAEMMTVSMHSWLRRRILIDFNCEILSFLLYFVVTKYTKEVWLFMKNDIDVLGRNHIIQNLHKILLMLSENKHGCVFAIDGGWGYGKTYVLEKLEAELEIQVNEETADDRYYVFHYNCWQYDYYEEPAIAIVSAMLEKFGEGIDSKVVDLTKDSWKYAQKILKGIAGDFVKNKIGINLVDVYEEIQKNAEDRVNTTYEFDDLFNFKETLDETRKKLKELARDKTVVLVVDELDRCMPSYAIKVLERLHHLFNDIDNVVVVLAIDSAQLEHSVREIYGKNIDTERYLKKFISFRVKLSLGDMQENIFEKYSYYFNHFTDVEGIMPKIMELTKRCKIDIRNFDKLIEKINLVHEIVCKEKMPSSVMFFELIWGLMKYKTTLAFSQGIRYGEVYGQNFSWIPEIDKAVHIELNACISTSVENYLKELKNEAKSNTFVVGMGEGHCKIKKDINGTTWYLLDKVLALNKSFYIEDGEGYEEMCGVCKDFNDLAKILW